MPIGVQGIRIGPQAPFPRSIGHQRNTKKIKMKYYAMALKGKVRTAYRIGQIAVRKGLLKETTGRRLKKRELRMLAINRISAGCRDHFVKYSDFMRDISLHNILLNRFVLAEMAVSEPRTFQALTELNLERQTAGLNNIAFHDGHKQSRIHPQPARPVLPKLTRHGNWVDIQVYEGNPMFDHRYGVGDKKKWPYPVPTERRARFNYKTV